VFQNGFRTGWRCWCIHHGCALGYLALNLQHVSDLDARRRLRSSSTFAIIAPRTVRPTIGDRAFPAAAVWNSLLESVQASPSMPVFRSRLKTELFAVCSYFTVACPWTGSSFIIMIS